MENIKYDFYNDALRMMSSPEIKGCLSALDSILGYKLISSDSQPFKYFHDYLTNPQPYFIEEWRYPPDQPHI